MDSGTWTGEGKWGHAVWSHVEMFAIECSVFSTECWKPESCFVYTGWDRYLTHLSSRRWAFHVEPPPLPGLHTPLSPVVVDIRASVVPVGGFLHSTGWRLALGSGRFSRCGIGGFICVEFTLRETGFRTRSSVSLSRRELRWPVSCDVLVSILWDLYNKTETKFMQFSK